MHGRISDNASQSGALMRPKPLRSTGCALVRLIGGHEASEAPPQPLKAVLRKEAAPPVPVPLQREILSQQVALHKVTIPGRHETMKPRRYNSLYRQTNEGS